MKELATLVALLVATSCGEGELSEKLVSGHVAGVGGSAWLPPSEGDGDLFCPGMIILVPTHTGVETIEVPGLCEPYYGDTGDPDPTEDLVSPVVDM